MQLLGYVRVSKVGGREGDGFISPRVQRERITAWATACGHSVEFLPDELDQSGGKADRPVFQSALERCEAGDADGVIVAKLDRFARSVPDAAAAIRRLEATDCVLVSVADQLDTSTPVGRFARTMMLAIGELELERIRESWDTAKADAVRRGIHLAAHSPVGYLRGDDRRLRPDPVVAPVVLEAFRLRAAGTPLADIGRFMVQQGARSYVGGEWSGRAVSMLLKNRVYLGEARGGTYHQSDAHPAIVPRALWEAAQVAPIVQAPRASEGYVLAGLLRCAGCRYRMAGQKGRRVIYRCKGRHAAGDCPHRAAVLTSLIDPWVEEQFLERVRAGGMIAVASVSSADLSTAEAELEQAESDLAAYRDDPEILRVLGRDAFVTGLEARSGHLERARHALGAQQAALSIGIDLPEPTTLLDTWPKLTTVERRHMLHAAIDAVMLRTTGKGRRVPIEERAVILWRGEAPDDLPRRGVFGAIQSFDISTGIAEQHSTLQEVP